jgi:hypothetical protein
MYGMYLTYIDVILWCGTSAVPGPGKLGAGNTTMWYHVAACVNNIKTIGQGNRQFML